MNRRAAPDFQPDGASAKLGGGALIAVLALIPLSAAIVAAMFWTFQSHTHVAPTTSLERAPLRPAGPRLEVSPKADRLAIEARAQLWLQGYAWSNRLAGLGRIPIERAMALQAQRGWPDADNAAKARP